MKALAYLTALAFLIGAQACTERIDLELNDDGNRRIVVDGWFTNIERPQEVRLTWTTSYFNAEAAPPVEGASVRITGPNLNAALAEVAPGVYQSESIAGEMGNTYALTIEYEGETFEASGFMREVAPIDTAFVELEPAEDEDDMDYYILYISTQELDGFGDDYMWLTSVNDVPLRDSLTEVFFVSDQYYDGVYVENADIEYMEAGTEASPGDTIQIEQYNIGRDGYEVLLGIMNETEWNGGLFDTPPANVATNLSNGALGYWGVAGVSLGEAVVPQ